MNHVWTHVLMIERDCDAPDAMVIPLRIELRRGHLRCGILSASLSMPPFDPETKGEPEEAYRSSFNRL